MFAKSEIEVKLDAEIISSLNELKSHEATSEEYGVVIDRVSKLYKLKSEERLKLVPSMDTAIVVAANIFGILWITRYERENVITSKALNFVFKPR